MLIPSVDLYSEMQQPKPTHYYDLLFYFWNVTVRWKSNLPCSEQKFILPVLHC